MGYANYTVLQHEGEDIQEECKMSDYFCLVHLQFGI